MKPNPGYAHQEAIGQDRTDTARKGGFADPPGCGNIPEQEGKIGPYKKSPGFGAMLFEEQEGNKGKEDQKSKGRNGP